MNYRANWGGAEILTGISPEIRGKFGNVDKNVRIPPRGSPLGHWGRLGAAAENPHIPNGILKSARIAGLIAVRLSEPAQFPHMDQRYFERPILRGAPGPTPEKSKMATH